MIGDRCGHCDHDDDNGIGIPEQFYVKKLESYLSWQNLNWVIRAVRGSKLYDFLFVTGMLERAFSKDVDNYRFVKYYSEEVKKLFKRPGTNIIEETK